MSTDLIDYLDEGNVSLTRYWGGKDCGMMYQLTEKNGVRSFVSFNRDDMLRLCNAFIASLIGTEEDK